MEGKKYQHLITDFSDFKYNRPYFDGKAHMVTDYDGRNYKDTAIWMHTCLVYKAGCGMGGGDYWERILPDGTVEKHVASRHRHDGDEIFIFLGTDPEHPDELGGEVKFWLGKDDDEEMYIITKPSVVYVPAGTWHNPNFYSRVDHPFIEVVVMPGKEHNTFDNTRYMEKTQNYPAEYTELYGKYIEAYRPKNEGDKKHGVMELNSKPSDPHAP